MKHIKLFETRKKEDNMMHTEKADSEDDDRVDSTSEDLEDEVEMPRTVGVAT